MSIMRLSQALCTNLMYVQVKNMLVAKSEKLSWNVSTEDLLSAIPALPSLHLFPAPPSRLLSSTPLRRSLSIGAAVHPICLSLSGPARLCSA